MGESRRIVPHRYARYYLENAPSLVWLAFANVLALLVGVHYYVETMPSVPTFLWPLYADSPTAIGLMLLSLVTLIPNLGQSLSESPHNRVLAYLHTLAFVWLVKMGLWTAVVINVGFDVYVADPLVYLGLLVTHLMFVAEALLVPHYGSTTRGALALALVLALANDLFDYGLNFHPPMRYDPGLTVAIASVLLSVAAVLSAKSLLPTKNDS
jgi:uncharacterized membrane protein YpjA